MKFAFKTLMISLSLFVLSANAEIFSDIFKTENEMRHEETSYNIKNLEKDIENLKNEQAELDNRIINFKKAEQPQALIIKDGVLSPEQLETYLKEKKTYEESLAQLEQLKSNYANMPEIIKQTTADLTHEQEKLVAIEKSMNNKKWLNVRNYRGLGLIPLCLSTASFMAAFWNFFLNQSNVNRGDGDAMLVVFAPLITTLGCVGTYNLLSEISNQ